MDICFVLNVYKEDINLVQRVVTDLQRFNIDSDILVLYDGTISYNIPNVQNIVYTDRLKHFRDMRWTHRYINEYLERSAALYLIKIDPDTCVLNTIKNLPISECIFAHCAQSIICKKGIWKIPHGGALGYTRGLAKKLIDKSMLLNNADFSNPSCGIFQDLMLRNIIHKYDIPLVDRKDFVCGERTTPDTVFCHPLTSNKIPTYLK